MQQNLDRVAECMTRKGGPYTAMNKVTHCSAPIDKKGEAIYQFGDILNRFAELDIKGININKVDSVDRNIAVITYENGFKKKVNIAGDSVLQAIKDIIEHI